MAISPLFKVYNAHRVYIASCRHVEDAAALIALYGRDATIRWGHSFVVWHEGAEARAAGESYDNVQAVVYSRIKARHEKKFREMSGNEAVAE